MVTFVLIPLCDPVSPGGRYFTQSCMLMFSIIEAVRYPYYLLKNFNLDKTLIGRFYGYLRYTIFIIVYPIGAFGEVVIGFGCLEIIRQSELQSTSYSANGQVLISNADQGKLYSILLPNKWNFAFDFEYFILSMPVLYLFFFPMNYMHMFR